MTDTGRNKKTLILVIVALAPLCVINTVQSLKWDIIWDAEIFCYIGWLVSEGFVPYRDIFVVNFPGALLLYAFVVKVLGTNDFLFRIFDLSVLFAISISMFLYCKKHGALTGILAALLFSCFHLSAGAMQAGQRDYVLVVFLLAGALFCVVAVETGRLSRFLFLSGLCLGLGITIKPNASIFFCAFGLLLGIHLLRTQKRVYVPFVVFASGASAAPLCIVAWLWRNDGIAPFLDILWHYVVPLYSSARLAPFALSLHVNAYFTVPVFYIALVFLLVSAVHYRLKGRWSFRGEVVFAGIVCGFLHLLTQQKLFYHYYPLFAFIFILVAMQVAEIKFKRNKKTELVIVCLVVYFVAGQAERSYNAVTAHISWKNKYQDAIAHDVVRYLPPGGTIQPLLFTGMHNALRELRLPPLTRFIYDYPFYHDAQRPYIRNLRQEFIAAITETPPSVIILQRASWPYPEYARLEKFPAFGRVLEQYDLVVENIKYRIYKYKG